MREIGRTNRSKSSPTTPTTISTTLGLAAPALRHCRPAIGLAVWECC